MLDKLKRVARQSFVYGIGSVLNKLLGFILIPMYMKHIPIADFGNLVYLETLIVFLSTFVGFGIGPAHQRFFYKEHENKTYGVYLFNIFFGSIIISFLTLLPTIIFSDSLALFLCKDVSRSLIFKYGMWIVLVEVIYAIPLYILQYEEKPVQYLMFNILKLLLSFGLTIFMVTSLHMGIEGMFAARLIGGGVTLLIATFTVVLPRCKVSFQLEPIVKSIKFGLPYVISNIGFTLFIISDRIMLNWLSTPEQVGKYGFGFRIANFINLIFIQTIGQSYFPSIMSNEKKENNVRYYRKMLTYYCFLMALLILGFLFTYKDFLQILGKNKDYWDGLKVVPILALSFLVGGMNYFVGVGLFLSNKTKYFLIPSFAAFFTNFGLNLFLIPRFGMIGAACSVFAAQVIYSSILSSLSGMFYKISFEWFKVILICLIGISIYIAGQWISGFSLWIIFPIRLALMVLFPIALYKLNFFEAIEIQRIKDGVNKLRRMVRI